MGMVLQAGRRARRRRGRPRSKPAWRRRRPSRRSTACAPRGCSPSPYGGAADRDGEHDVGRRRRDGVDVERALPAARRAARLPLRQRHAGRRDGPRRADGLLSSTRPWRRRRAKVAAELGDHARGARPLRVRVAPPRARRARSRLVRCRDWCRSTSPTKAPGKIVVDGCRSRRATASRRRSAAAHRRSGSTSRRKRWSPIRARYSPYVTGDVPTRRVDRDEPVRADASLEAMAKLKPLDAGGTITAGNAPGVNDGAAALVLAERRLRASATARAARDDRRPRATSAWEPPYSRAHPGDGRAEAAPPSRADARATSPCGRSTRPSPRSPCSPRRDLGARPERRSTCKAARSRSAIRSAHPARASSARVVHQLRRRGGGLGHRGDLQRRRAGRRDRDRVDAP